LHKNYKDKRLEAYRKIKEFILNYRVQPGQRLEHEFLSNGIGVSNTPIREALNRLSEEGYVYQIKNRGYFVSDLSYNEVEELYEVREALEIFAIQKTMSQGARIKNTHKKQIKKMIDLYYKYVHEETFRNRLPLDQELHLFLAKLSDNITLCNMLRNVFEKLNYKRKVVGLHPQRGFEASKEHYEIYHFLIDSKQEKLIEAMQRHIRKGKEKLLEMLKAREAYLRG
jgi:DNA-binding GntR family transcriptional regulator